MSPRKQAADESDRREGENLSDHPYGLPHPLIGTPCIYEQASKRLVVVPYKVSQKGKPLLTVVGLPEEHLLSGREDIQIRALSAVHPDKLTPMKISTGLAQAICRAVHDWSVGNRNATRDA